MKKNYLLVVILLSFFPFNSSAITNSLKANSKADSQNHQTNRTNRTLLIPSSNPTVSATSICEGETLTLTANFSEPVIAPVNTFQWTGPNGYTSTDENPVIPNVSTANSGIYTLTIYDALSNVIETKNTPSVTVNTKVNPTFTAIPPGICFGGVAPILSTRSSNGITGTWNPAVVSNTAHGFYTFTPDPGQCANPYSFTFFVVPNSIPTFSSIPSSLCQGDPAPILPGNSDEGIPGNWSPSFVDNTTTDDYIFTPSAGLCAIPTTITITVIPKVTPTFTIPASICDNDPAPILATTSNNGITGTWNPATVTTTPPGDYNYTFTPDAGQCTNPTASITIKVKPYFPVPTFAPVAPICSGDTAPVLPASSIEGITGTWNPATVSNTTSQNYIFTATAGECVITPTANLFIVVNPIQATFAPIAPICSGDTAPVLPATSIEGVTGTWNPSTVSNTTSNTYVFTPDAGQCTTTQVPLSVTVNPTQSTFDPIAPICSGDTAPVLPTTSIEGVTGTWNPATVSNITSNTYVFTPDAGQCTTTQVPLSITVRPTQATFAPIAPICSGDTAPVLPTTSIEGVTGTWNPATVSNTASNTYVFTPDAGQCTTTQVPLSVTVNPIQVTFAPIAPICSGDTAPVLPTTSIEGVTGTWNPTTVSNTVSNTYVFTPDAGQCTTTQVPLSVTVRPTQATFAPIAPICSGDTAPVLPTTSIEGVTGTWNPATVSNTASNTYVFTPDAGQCTTTQVPLSVTVNPIQVTFAPIAPICSGDTAPVLPTTSIEGVTGTWNPATVSNTASNTYMFTPDAGQCTTTQVPLSVTVNPIQSTFAPIAPICSGDTAPVLPTTSIEGITGTWNPATVSNTVSNTYVFTPDAGQCTTTQVPLNVTVNPIQSTFAPITPICSGDTAPILPATSIEGVTGTWNPATVSNTASDTYMFTPDAGQCTTTQVSLSVTVNPIQSTFAPIAPICSGDTAPLLPTTSIEGVTGTWNPATVSNTVSNTYVFTPDAGQCTTTQVPLSITVRPIQSTFAPIDPICSGDTAPVLPATSIEGVTGTWNPATVSNTASDTYVFTPDAGQCTTTQVPLNVTVNQKINPTFNPISDVCYGTATIPTLPATSINGITGTWNPAIVSNTVAADYIFTPNTGECANPTTLHININIITPDFNPITSVCQGAAAPTLPTTSTNGISGTWFPATVDTSIAGTVSYVFTPNPEQCATGTNLPITINPTAAIFAPIGPICNGDVLVLPTVSQNGVAGTWLPAANNTQTTDYIFTPDAGQCATTPVPMQIVVNQKITPTFTTIAPICSGETAPILPLTSNNGVTGTWSPTPVDNLTPGTVSYVFTPNTGECATTASLPITIYPSPTDIAFTTTDIVNNKSEGTITITGVTSGVPPFEYSINSGSFTTNTTYSGLLPGDYTITVKDSNGCQFSTVATISSLCIIPNGISPNGDDINDTLNLNGCNISKLIIYNRYGKEVSKFDNYTNQWAGTNEKGEHLPDGTYFYAAEIKDGTTKSGWIYVTR